MISKSVSSEYEASLMGSGAVAQGESAVAVGKRGVYVSGDVSTSTVITGDDNMVNMVAGRDVIIRDKVSGDKITHDKEVIPSDNDFRRIATRSTFIRNQLEISYGQAREQAYTWFRFSLIAAGVGFLLVVAGVIAVVLGQVTEGMITAISSIVPNTVAALFFLQSKASNERVDVILRKLSEAREIETAVEIANSIETKRERDRLKSEIVRKVIGLSSE
jgi:hypothetical protein